jgi:DNA-binding SARP family transcriptional activator/predicted ATPase
MKAEGVSLSIRLLGSPQILRDQTQLTVSRRKSRALVYYLAARGTIVAREQLLALFWPDLERAAAQQTLRTTLHGLRKTLGPAVSADDGTLRLAGEVDVDTRVFEARLASSQTDPVGLKAALDLYRGDFLDGFSLPDSAAFDDWAAAERERLRRLAVSGLAVLAGLYQAQGQYPAALAIIERALAFDQLQEDLQREALRLHYLAGDRAGAIRRYAHLRHLLDDEMGVLPMAETRALYDSILTDNLAASPPLPAAPLAAGLPPLSQPVVAGSPALDLSEAQPVTPLPFAGREAELQTLRASLAPEAPLHARKLVLVEGEPGIGKSRLVEEFMQASAAIPLSGAAHELEQGLPYEPLIEALRSLMAHSAWPALHAGLQAQLAPVWLAEVARLLPELQPGLAPPGGGPDEPRLWEGVHQFLLATARQHPITFFVDDLQWADASTLAVLNYLSRRARVDGAAISYLAAARTEERGSPLAAFLQTLTREERLIRVPLTRLDPEAVTALAGQWAARRGAPPEEASALASWLLPASEGNPFVLVELLRYACEQGLLREGGHLDVNALGGSPVVPQTVYSLIRSRLARLSEPARRVLDAAVAAGREFDFEVVYRAAGLSEAAGLDALDELRGAALVHPVGAVDPAAASNLPPLTRYAFDHSLTMEVAYREVGEPRHRLLHRRVAEALEQVYGRQRLDAVAGLLASHFAEGNEPKRAAPYAFRAGQMAARLAAWAEAVAFFEQALPAEDDPDRRQAIAAALGDAHFSAGNMAPSSEAYRLALTLALDAEEQDPIESIQLKLARAQLPQARFAEAKRLARQVLESATEPETVAAAEFILGTAFSLEGADLASATQHLEAAASRLRAAVDRGQVPPGRLAQYKFELGSVAAQQGDLPGAVNLYREALEIADHSDHESALPYRILARNNLAYHLHLLSPRDPAAQRYAEDGLRLAHEQGLLSLMTYLYSTLGEIALAQGDLDAAERHFKEGLALAERLPMPERVAGLTANLGLVARGRGEAALALYRLSAAMAQADALGTRHLAAQIRLWLAPLLPAAEGRTRLKEVHAFAESASRARLLEEAAELENEMAAGR